MTTDYTLPPDRLRELTGVEPDDMVTNEQTLPSSAPSTPAVTTNDAPPPLHRWTLRDLVDNPPPPIVPLIAGDPAHPDRPGFVDSESVMMIYSAPKIGKSWLALALARSLSSGTPFLGRYPVVTPGPVLYLDLEMSRSVWHHRWSALERVEPLGVDLPLHIITRRDERRLAFDPVNIIAVKEAVTTVNPVLIIVDTFRAAFDGDENDTGETQTFVDLCREVGAEANPPAAVLLLHHAAKAGGYRGSSGIYGAVDLLVELERATSGVVTLNHVGGRFSAPPTITYQVEEVGDDGVRLTWGGVPDRFAKTREEDQRVWEIIRDLAQDGTAATAANVAAVLFETATPTESHKTNARRRLQRLVDAKRADAVERRFTTDDGKPWKADVYYPKDTGKPSPRITAKVSR